MTVELNVENPLEVTGADELAVEIKNPFYFISKKTSLPIS
jgi:hypothetical protein